MMAAILNSAILDSAILHIKNFTHSFWLNLMMAVILNSAILDSVILVFPLKHTHTCQDWFPPFAHKKLNSLILTQLDDGSHLELCHLGFSHFAHKKLNSLILTQLDDGSHLELCHLGFSHFVQEKTSLIHSHLTWWWQPSCILPFWILPSLIHPFCSKFWLQLIQSDSNSFILTQLDDGSHLGFSHFAQKIFTHSFWINLMMAAILNSAILELAILYKKLNSFAQNQLHSFILTQLDDAAILNSAILESAILHKKNFHSFILTQLDDGSHLEFCQLQFQLLGLAHLSFSSQTHSHLPRLVHNTCTKNFTHWFWLNLMIAAILELCHPWFSHFVPKKFTHSFWLNLMMAAILNSAMLDSDTAILDSNTLLSSLRFTQKHSHSILTLTQINSIWLTWWWQPSWILPSWNWPFCTKNLTHLHKTNFTHSFWLNLMMQPYWILPSWNQPFCTKKTFTLILTQLDDGSHLEFCQLQFQLLGLAHLSFSSQTHSHLPRLVHNTWTKNFTHWFWLNLMIAAILNCAILDSAILYQKNSLIHSDSTWWWQPSWILPCWIQTLPSWIQTPCYLLSDSLKNTLTPFWLWLKVIQSDSNSFILTSLDDGSHLEFCHLGFSHSSFSSQTHSHLPRLVPTICT